MSGALTALMGGPMGSAGGGAKVYRPKVEVKLLKMVQRRGGTAERFTAAEREIDLTPFLGDGGGIRTTKTIYEAAGGFALSFSDQSPRHSCPWRLSRRRSAISAVEASLKRVIVPSQSRGPALVVLASARHQM